MIVDTSVIVALLKGEVDGPRLSAALSAPEAKHISAATFLETAIVVDANRDPVMSRRFDELLRDTSIEIAPVTERQVRIAREAYRDFGRGSGHPAGLNFGDCFAYALAKDLGEPLLFKGSDFIHTDIEPALK